MAAEVIGDRQLGPAVVDPDTEVERGQQAQSGDKEGPVVAPHLHASFSANLVNLTPALTVGAGRVNRRCAKYGTQSGPVP